MYKLTYKGQFVDGFDTDQVIGNLAQLLNLKPKAVRLAFLSDRPSVVKILDSASEVERWCAAFQEAGVYLDVANVNAADINGMADQIELDLELHELDDGDDEPDARHYLIRKVKAPEPEIGPQTFGSQPLVARAVADYSETIEGEPVDDQAVNGEASNGPSLNGHRLSEGLVPEAHVSESGFPEKKINGSHYSSDLHLIEGSRDAGPSNSNDSYHSVAVTADNIEVASGASQDLNLKDASSERFNSQPEDLQAPEDLEKSAVASDRDASVHGLSVAAIDALAAQQVLDAQSLLDKESLERTDRDGQTSTDSTFSEPVLNASAEDGIFAATPADQREIDHQAELAAAASDVASEEAYDSRQQRYLADGGEKRNSHGDEEIDEPTAYDSRKDDSRGHDERDYDEREYDEQEYDEREYDEDYDEREEEEDELLEEVDFHKSHFKWGMLVILLAIFATAGTIYWLKRSTWAPVTVAPHEHKINAAMASSSLFGLVHADVKRLQSLSPKTDIFASVTGPTAGFWKSLGEAGVNPNQQVEDIWLGAYSQNGQTKVLWVLYGSFTVDSWRDWLKKSHLVHSDNPEGIIFSTVDENSCELSPALSANITNSQIVLGAPEIVAAFAGRLQTGAPAEKNLETWAKGYNTQMISAALFQPGQLPEGTATTALGKLSLPAAPIRGIYLGLEPKIFPPAIELNALIESENQEFVVDAAQKIAAAVAAAKTTIATDWPETLPLYEHIKVSQQDEQVRAVLYLDDQAPKQLHFMAASLMSRAFAPDIPAPALEAERLEDNPPQFANLESAELPSFTSVKHFNEAFVAQTSSGPFGIGVRNVEQTDQGVEINLDVNAFNLPNLGKEADGIALRITDIVDHQDQSLLASADVGGCAGGLKQPAKINLVYQGNTMENGQLVSFVGVQGAKKILLPAGIALSSVGAVKGVVSHQLPTTIERLRIDGPLAGKTVDLHGVHLRFMSSSPNRLHFHVSGNSAALLHVNALNDSGSLLATSNTVRSDAAFSPGKAISIDYQGQVAAVEIIVASKLEQRNYEFSIARLFPPARPFVMEKTEPTHLNAASLPALEKGGPPNDVVFPYQTPRQTIAAGPALIALNDLTINGQQFSLAADIYTHNSHPLAEQLSAVRLMLTDVEDSAGALHSVDYQAPAAMEHMGGNWADGKFQPDPNRPWLRGQIEMRDRLLEQTDVVAFWGKLVFLATEDPIPIKVPFQFGMQWNSNNGILKLRRWEAGRLIFDVDGDFPELMAVKALDDAGRVVSQPAELRTSFGRNTIELEVKQIPDTMEFHIARTQNSKEFPVEIRVLH